MALKKTPDCLVVVDGSNVMVGGNALNGCATVLSTLSAGTELKILEGSGMNPTSAQTSLGSLQPLTELCMSQQVDIHLE